MLVSGGELSDLNKFDEYQQLLKTNYNYYSSDNG